MVIPKQNKIQMEVKKKFLLFESSIQGHRLEYIHHIYMGMRKFPENDYVIVVPKSFNKEKEIYQWPKEHHILIDYLSSKEEDNLKSKGFINIFRRALLLRKYIKKHQANIVFLITIMGYQFFIPLFWGTGVKIRGIIYKIYLYEWNQSTYWQKVINVIKYTLFARFNLFNKIFILNDTSAAAYLNRRYHTSKFLYLVDPFNKINYTPKNIRTELGVKDDQILFLHFGGLTARKGTLILLNSISKIPKTEKDKFVFIFAGKIHDDIKEDFYSSLHSLMVEGRNIFIYDHFCTNEFLYDLCFSCNVIIAPYLNASQSSGVVGYAQYFGKLIIGNGKGLLGKLIKRNGGIVLKEISVEALIESYRKVLNHKNEQKHGINKSSSFAEVILDC